MPNQPYNEALYQLRRVVEAAPDELMDMYDLSHRVQGCGTAHCALGWAAIDSWFQHNTEIRTYFSVIRAADNEHYVTARISAIFQLSDAASRMFSISKREAEMLFAMNDYALAYTSRVAKADVILRIEQLMNGEDIEPYAAPLLTTF